VQTLIYERYQERPLLGCALIFISGRASLDIAARCGVRRHTNQGVSHYLTSDSSSITNPTTLGVVIQLKYLLRHQNSL
jgi:hypothetical protein